MVTRNFKNVFAYAHHCECNYKRNIRRDTTLGEVKTTFFTDLSVAEWCEQSMNDKNAVENTINNACEAWWDYPEYIIELLFAVNMKSWEQYTLGSGQYEQFRAFTREAHMNYARYYGEKYPELRDKILDHYIKDGRLDIVEQIYNAID